MNIILIFPAFLLILVVFAIPIFRYLWLSFHASSVITGLNVIPNNSANWQRILSDDRFWQDAYQTLRFATVSVTLEIFLAILIVSKCDNP